MRPHIRVGLITRTHGVKGEVSVIPLTDDPNRFKILKQVYVENDDLPLGVDCEIEYVRFHNNRLHVKFKGYDGINDVAAFKGKYIAIDEIDRVKLPENRYYVCDLLDCKVYELSGKLLGTIVDVLETGGNDVYVVKPNDGICEEVLIPAVKSVIKDVSVKEKKVIVEYSLDGR
jgi:16S rRNA processing protein RimM